MPIFADKTQPKNSEPISSEGSQTLIDGAADFYATDARPAAIAQRKFQEMLNDSPRVRQLSATQKMINSARHVRQLDAFQAVQRTEHKDAPTFSSHGPVQRVVNLNSVEYTEENLDELLKVLADRKTPNDFIKKITEDVKKKWTVFYEISAPVEGKMDDPEGKMDDPEGEMELLEPLADEDEVDPKVLPRAAPNRKAFKTTFDNANPGKMTRKAYNAAFEEKWKAYQAAYQARTDLVSGMGDPNFKAGQILYHGTTRDTALLIKDSGLMPRLPEWGDASSSKDNYLSMTEYLSGAHSLGGKGVGVVLRVKLNGAEVGPGKWRRVSRGEVLTTQSFAPERLEWSWQLSPKKWSAMDTYKGGQPTRN